MVEIIQNELPSAHLLIHYCFNIKFGLNAGLLNTHWSDGS